MRVRKDVAEMLGLLSWADTVADVLLDAPGDLCDAGINVGDEGAQRPRDVLNLLRGRRDDFLERPERLDGLDIELGHKLIHSTARDAGCLTGFLPLGSWRARRAATEARYKRPESPSGTPRR